MAAAVVLASVLFGGALGLQAIRQRVAPRSSQEEGGLYLRSGTTIARIGLAYDAVLADVYWIRAVQYFGRTRLSHDPDKRYDLLYPLLDIATTLDPRFTIAYRFGAIFLAEAFPDGPGRPDQAIALLRKGLAADPAQWLYAQDAGFVYYWWLQDYRTAAAWFDRASRISGAPWWLRSLAATTLADGGDRRASRQLWEQIYRTADNEWLRNNAQLRLAQLDAMDQIDALTALVGRFKAVTGRQPGTWNALVASGWFRSIPVDPAGVPFDLDPSSGGVSVAKRSPLFPMPTGSMMVARPAR